MNYLVSYVDDKGNEQKEMFESAQMVSGFIEQLLHMNQARPEDIKIFRTEQLGFHVETIPVVKIDEAEVAATAGEVSFDGEVEEPVAAEGGPEFLATEENPS